ncbi:MAG: alpha/beta hydrolase [Burkholderiales bacterium]|nr:alpha/beta hydrolase [Burkholderiales bacterium]
MSPVRGLVTRALAVMLALVPARALPLDSRFFTTSDGVRLHALEGGRPGAPAIAFVPGWSMPAGIWHFQLEALGTRYRVAALDPRGQGQSEAPRTGYTLERRAADLREFLAPYRHAVLVGWSLGALESLEMVRAHGEASIAGLVLVDSSVGEPPAPPAGVFKESLQSNRRRALDEFMRAIFRRPPPEAELSALVTGALRMRLEDSLALLSYPVPREYWRAAAHGVHVPLLYVVTPQFAEQAANLQRNRPGTEAVVFEHAGHALFVDEPERFNALLEDFARRAFRSR